MSKQIATRKLGLQHRSFAVARADVDAEKRTVALSFSSEAPVAHPWGNEILDHKPGACRLARLQSGAPLLVEHDTRHIVGVVESAEIADGKGRAIVRFGKSAMASECLQDVADGIRQLVSVGYRIHAMDLQSKVEGVETYRVTDWEPVEVSLVSVPADPSVGVGRSADETTETTIRVMSDETKPNTAPPADFAALERQRVADILAIAKTHNARDLVDEAVAKCQTVADFQHAVLSRYQTKPPVASAEIGLTDKESAEWSLTRAIAVLSRGKPLDGLEAEASRAMAKRIGRDPQGFYIPVEVAKRVLTAGSQTAGGFTVGTNVLASSLIDLLRNNTVVAAMGARSLSGLVGNVAIPRATGGATAYWLDETTAVTASQQAFGQVLLTPHRLAAETRFTKELVAQSSIDVEAFVRDDIARVLAIAKDLAALHGTGNAGQPLGISNESGRATDVAFGAAATFAKVVEFETNVGTANALAGSLGYVTSPAARGKWKTKSVDTGSGVFIWAPDNTVNGYKAMATTQIASDIAIFANWNDLILADWAGIDVVVDNLTLASTGQIKVVVTQLCDIALRQPKSFCISSDSAAQ